MAIIIAVAPGDIEPSLGGVGEVFERLAIDRVDRHPLPVGDDADDAVARKRMAAAGEMKRHVRDQSRGSATAMSLRPAFPPHPAKRDRPWPLPAGCGLTALGEAAYRPGQWQTLPDRNIQVV